MLLLFPLAVMILFVMFNTTNQGLAGTGAATFCTPGQNCTPNNINGTSSLTFYCPYGSGGKGGGPIGSCQIFPSCVNNLSPAYCFASPINILPGFGGTYLHEGDSVTATSAQAAAGHGYAFFGFNTNGTLLFVGFIAVLIGIGTLAGFTVLGSGLQGESIQMLTQGALWLGAWMILSGLEGVGSSTDTFSQFNFFFGFGTALYAILTVMYLVGFGAIISRAGV